MACTLKSVLDSVLQSEDDWRLRLMDQWTAIVGDLHTRMRLECIKHDTLIIGVYDSHWMHELFMLSRVIIKTINTKLGGEYIAKLRFVLAKTVEKVKRKSTQQSQETPECMKTMSAQQRYALKEIKDDQLQDALQKLFYRCGK